MNTVQLELSLLVVPAVALPAQLVLIQAVLRRCVICVMLDLTLLMDLRIA